MEPISPGPCVTLILTSPGPCVTLMLTSRGPCVTLAWQAEGMPPPEVVRQLDDKQWATRIEGIKALGAQLEQLPDGAVHPVALFHVPIQGSGMTIADLFALGRVEGAGSVGLDGYDWEYFEPLRENVVYEVSGRVVDVDSRATLRRRSRVTF